MTTLPRPPQATAELLAGARLLSQMTGALRQSQQDASRTTSQYKKWRGQARPDAYRADPNSNVFGEILGDMFTDMMMTSFLGLPMCQGLTSGAQEVIRDGFDFAMAAHEEVARPAARRTQSEENALRRFESDPDLEEAYAQLYAQTMAMQKSKQKQLSQSKKMMMMLLMTMMMQDEEVAAPQPSLEVAADVLRNPSYARFKQNRHSMHCIRSEFAAMADSITPRFDAKRFRPAA